MLQRSGSKYNFMTRLGLLVFLLLSCVCAEAQNLAFTPGVVSLYAGTANTSATSSTPNFSGPLSQLVLNGPESLATDSDGNMYIMDSQTAVIRVVAAGSKPIPALPGVTPQAGYVYTVAGNGTSTNRGSTAPCSGGDIYGNGCAATVAYLELSARNGIAVDGSGNIYFASAASNQVRVVYGGGTVPGVTSPAAGHVYAVTNVSAASSSNNTDSPDGTPAAQAVTNSPISVAVDALGNIFFVDSNFYYSTVAMIYVSGNMPYLPSGATAGNFYTLNSATNCNSAEAGCGVGGPVSALQIFGDVFGLAVDSSENLYVGIYSQSEVLGIYAGGTMPGVQDPTPGYVYAVAGTGTAASNSGAYPAGGSIAVKTPISLTNGGYPGQILPSGGNLYIADGPAVYKVDSSGLLYTVLGGTALCSTAVDIYDDGCGANTTLNTSNYMGVALDSSGNLYASDYPGGGGVAQNLIHKVNVGSSLLDLSTTAGLANSTSVYVSNNGSTTLQLSGINFTGLFSQISTGSNDCSSATSLAPGATCLIDFSFNPTAVGSDTGSIVVSSNASNSTSGTNTVKISATATQATSTITLTSSPQYPAVANSGQPVTFTATVAPQYQDTNIPSGTVAFVSGYTGTSGSGTTLGSGSIGSGGVATFTTSGLPAGSVSVTAVYSGDSIFEGSSSSTAVVNVASAATPAAEVVVTASATAVNSGQSVTLTATVTPYSGTGTPTGTVTFQDGNNPLPNGTVTLSGNTATLTTTTLPPGTNQLVAVYNGNSSFAANTSTPVAVTVTAGGVLQFQPGTIHLVAGNYFNYGGPVTSGTSATGSSAILTNPAGVAADSYGDTYIADNGSNKLYVVAGQNPSIPGITNPTPGDIYVMGTGSFCSPGSCGDGGPVSAAGFTSPSAVAVDPYNNIYVFDSREIRKISAQTGYITQVAGSDTANTTYSGDGGLAINAGISAVSLAVDANGDIYFADEIDHLVRRVDGRTGIITTVAGDTAGVALKQSGSNALASQCLIAPCGDGGPATSSQFAGPIAVALDSIGNLYIADQGNLNTGTLNVVRKIDPQTGTISLVVGAYDAGSCNVQGCGDGGPATSASFQDITGLSADSAGDLYISDVSTIEVREVNATSGIINTVVGQEAGDYQENNNYCQAAPCGNGGPATGPTLYSPLMSALDTQGNLYVIDGGQDWDGEGVVWEIPAGTLSFAYGSENLGTTTSQTVSINNIGLEPLAFSALTMPTPNFDQQLTGNGDCTATTVLASGTSCELSISFFPTATGVLSGTATIASNSTNATSGQNTITLSGTGVGLGGTTPQTIAFQAVPTGLVYGSSPILLSASSDATRANSADTISYQVTGPAAVSGSTLTILGAGTVTVTAYQFGDSQYAAAAPVSQSLVIAPATLTIAAKSLSLVAGTVLPTLTYTATGFVNSDTQSLLTGQPVLTVVDAQGSTYPVGSTPLSGTYTITIQQGTLALAGSAAANYKMVLVNGTLNVTGTTLQQLSFPSPSNATYGAAPIALGASSSSGLPITYSVQGPASIVGNLLTVTGAGVVAVTANQGGNSQYAAATPLTVSFNVSKASLTVTAANVSVAQGAPLPTLPYTFTGFVNGDNQAVVTGSPALTTTATSSSPVGQYPITVALGTLTAANYSFNPVAGTLTIVTPVAQTINFPAVAGVTYGATPIALGATSSSGLGVSYTVAGPAVLSGNVLTITGAGTITVTAAQAGNNTYGPASPVVQSLTVSPAVLTVTANNATRMNDTQNPIFSYVISGFVNGDTQGLALSGTPVLTTTATISSSVGTYPIAIAAGTLKSANYTFTFNPGILTITTGGPSPDFSLTATPQSVTVEQGQIVQATITLSPVNFYQGLVKLSCGSLPTNVTCTFSPLTLAADGSNTPVTTTLTINTNTAAPVVGQIQPMKPAQVMSAAFLYLPAGLGGLFLTVRRRRIAKLLKGQQWLLLLLLLGGAAGLTACGGGSMTSSSSTLAAPGSSTITLTAADSSGGVSHTINIALKVQ